MYSKLLITCVLLTLTTLGASLPLSNEGDNHSGIERKPNLSESNVPHEKQRTEDLKEKCLRQKRAVLESDDCERLELEEKKNLTEYSYSELRCGLIEDIAKNICSNDTLSLLQLESYIKPTVSLCNQTSWKVFESRTTAITRKIIKLWSIDTTQCKTMCYKSAKADSYAVCLFMLGFYVDPAVDMSNNTKQNGTKLGTSTVVEQSKANSQPPHNDLQLSDKNIEETDDNGSVELSEDTHKRIESHDEKSIAEIQEEYRSKLSKVEDLASFKAVGVPLPSSEIIDNEGSHAFFYFALMSAVCVVFYLMVYNKKKILALMVEGRRRNVKRRPNTAAYSKLDCNLEEAMASGPSTSKTNTWLY